MADKDPYGAIKFGEFRKYMQNKQSKLKEQEAIFVVPVLQGLSIHVNGYTDPPQSELRRLIVQYGGDYQHYLKKSKVTHIIATTLTNSKMNEFRAYKVVKPSWITDSIKEGQLLPWTSYRVINNESAQRQLVGKAQELCPDLKIIPYEFESYRAVSEQFYNILFRYADEIQAVSVDEALLEVGSHVTQADAQQEETLALTIRNEIRQTTGCEASIGMGSNVLLARLATKKAKPCNHYYCRPEDVPSFLSNQKVEDLPGVGYAMKAKLGEMNVATIGELALVTKSDLTSTFGPKTAQTLYNFARGIDDRPLITSQPRQSVSAEVNWGVRFENDEQAETFLESLALEVSERLKAIQKKGKSITLKVTSGKGGDVVRMVLVRSKSAGEAVKHLGCGECNSYSKSMALESFTDDHHLIAKLVKRALRSFTFLVGDIRGLSIQVQKLNKDDDEYGDIDGDQQKLKFGPPSDRLPPSNAHKPESSKSKMAVEYNVYMELPEEIRNELKDHYDIDLIRESSLPTTQSHPTQQPLDPSVSSTSITNNNTIFKIPESMDSSPTSFLPDLPNWSQLDPSALLALPSDMQKQVLQSYQSTKTTGSHEQRRIGNPSLPPPPPPSPPPFARLPPVPTKPTSSSTTANTGRVTKSLHSHRTNAKLNKKKSGNGITLTQIFPQSPKRTTDNGQSIFDDFRTTNAPAPGNGIHGDENIAPSIGVLNDDRTTLLNGMNPKDMDIWSQLPKDIQQELLETFRQEQEQKRIHTKKTARPPESLPPSLPEPTLMGKSDLSDLRSLISTWVHEYLSGPDPKDVDTVMNYFQELVRYKDLEKVQLLMAHLEWTAHQDNVSKSGWALVLQNMKRVVSDEMVSVFGAPLL
ncbi:hypothetical protein [Absidia glauca]|uniref:DNA repair protein REV1 n=1 Tax=Absidia glauca TaxID=4829 RepID=A0A163KW00_ABSGL|nr:hypothetical protein [Absidia glauca]